MALADLHLKAIFYVVDIAVRGISTEGDGRFIKIEKLIRSLLIILEAHFDSITVLLGSLDENEDVVAKKRWVIIGLPWATLIPWSLLFSAYELMIAERSVAHKTNKKRESGSS